MTLAELASYVATKTQMVDETDVAAAKTFLSKRYELIYNSYLWKDSLSMLTMTLDPSTDANVANGIVLLPQQIDRVVAMRNNSSPMQSQNLEEIYVDNFSTFLNDNSPLNSYGMLQRFNILNPVWLVCNPTSVSNIGSLLDSIDTSTANAVFARQQGDIVVAGGCPVDSVLVTKNTNTPQGGLTGINVPAGQTVSFSVPQTRYVLWLTATNPGGGLPFVSNAQFVTTGIMSAYLLSSTAANTDSVAGSTVTITSDNAADFVGGATPVNIKVTWKDSTDRYVYSGPIPATITPLDGTGYIEIESVFKTASSGNVTFTLNDPIDANYSRQTVIGTLAASDKQSNTHQRVRLSVKPATGTTTTLYVLGKKPFVPLDFDNEVPAIKNLDNCLIAFACADMWERARQFNKANAKMQEGATLLSELAKLETIQQANHSLMSVANGFGDSVDTRRSWGRIHY